TIQKAGSMSTAAPQQLSPDTIKKIQDVVKNPKFDIYIGKSDNRIRRLSVSVDFQIPSDQRAKFQGAEGGTLSFPIDSGKAGQTRAPRARARRDRPFRPPRTTSGRPALLVASRGPTRRRHYPKAVVPARRRRARRALPPARRRLGRLVQSELHGLPTVLHRL